MVQSINWTILLAVASASIVDGFLFTPKFQLFLNQMKQAGHQDFAITWDIHKQNCYKPNGGFSYTTNHNGKSRLETHEFLVK